jgi:hypothetical protein
MLQTKHFCAPEVVVRALFVAYALVFLQACQGPPFLYGQPPEVIEQAVRPRQRDLDHEGLPVSASATAWLRAVAPQRTVAAADADWIALFDIYVNNTDGLRRN